MSCLLAVGVLWPVAPAQVPTHGFGPDWRAWEPAAFAEAAREKKLILVNVAAAWCHWCHVMDHETYANGKISALLRERFITIRVDADARPDIAERYAEWGWPATAILTPDAQPVLQRRGYQEPDEFLTLLAGLVDDQKAGRPLAARSTTSRPQRVSDLAAARKRTEAQLDEAYDRELDGWGHRQKYPLSAPIEEAFRRGVLQDDAAALKRALATLTKETRILDPVWGGMYQYSVPATWDAPHFEKLAAIQAGAIENFAEAYAVTGDTAWLDRARSVLRYVDAFLRAPDGVFYTSQDADEGAVDGHTFFVLDDAARRRVGIPRVDQNVYADLNGLLIHARCRMFAVTGDVNVLRGATVAMDRLLVTHRTSAGGFRHGASSPEAPLYLADQAAMGRALVALHEVTRKPEYLDAARAVGALLLAQFGDEAAGGFFAQTADPQAVGVFAERRKPLIGNGNAVRLLLALAQREPDASANAKAFRAAADRALAALSAPEIVSEEGRFVGEWLLALSESIDPPVHVTVVGKGDDPAAQALHAAALKWHRPGRIVEFRAPGGQFADVGHAALFLCAGTACSLPITDPTALPAAAKAFLER